MQLLLTLPPSVHVIISGLVAKVFEGKKTHRLDESEKNESDSSFKEKSPESE